MMQVELVTPQKILAKDSAKIVSVPGSEGDLGVLIGHTPLLSALRVGEFRYKKEDEVEASFFINGGFVEVLPDKVTILAESAEKKEEIDKDRAKSSFDRAKKRIAEYKTNPDIDLIRAEASLLRAINRLKIISSN